MFDPYEPTPPVKLDTVIAARTIAGLITDGKWYDVHRHKEAQYEITDDSGNLVCVHKSHFRQVGQRIPQSTNKVALVLTKKIASDGGATGYYDLPAGATTLYDLIEHRDMNFSEGNVFKAVYRMGTKEGVDHLYDWNKIKFCAEREIARLEKKDGK